MIFFFLLFFFSCMNFFFFLLFAGSISSRFGEPAFLAPHHGWITHPNLVSQAREIENFCEDCKLAAPLGFFRSFGPRFRVH